MTLEQKDKQVDVLDVSEFPSQLDLVSECVEALVEAGQEEAVPYLALALLSTYTLKSKSGGWEELVSCQDSDLIQEAELWYAAVHIGELSETIETRNDQIRDSGIFLIGLLKTLSRVREMEVVVRKHPHLFYGDPALAERLKTIRSFSRTSGQLSRQIVADHPHKPLDVLTLKSVVANVFQKHGLQFTYTDTDGTNFYYADEAGQKYKLDTRSCLAANPPTLIYAYPFEVNGRKILKWAANAVEVPTPVLSSPGQNGRTPQAAIADFQPAATGTIAEPDPAETTAVTDSEETTPPAEESSVAEDKVSDKMRQLWERLAGNFIANLQAHPNLMRNVDLIERRKSLGQEVPTPSEMRDFYYGKLQAAKIGHKRQAREVDLTLTEADIEEILKARSAEPEPVAPPVTNTPPADRIEETLLEFSETVETWYEQITAGNLQSMNEYVDFQWTLFEREEDHLFVPTPEQIEVFIKMRLAQIDDLENLDLTFSEADLEPMFHDWLKMQLPEAVFDQIQQQSPERETQIVQMVEVITGINQSYELAFAPPNEVEKLLFRQHLYQSPMINFSGIVRQKGSGTYLIYENQPVLVVLPYRPKAVELDYESPVVVAGLVRNQIGSVRDPETGDQIPVMVMSARRRADKQ